MLLSLNKADLMEYTSRQLNNMFPDKNIVALNEFSKSVDIALDRLNYCFKHVAYPRYNKSGITQFNHLYADHYLMYLWFLGNTLWMEENEIVVPSKIYYLNKALHGLDCMYDTGMPDIFLVFHASGTMLGKASYSDYFVALQGCTVGSQKGKYPIFGKGVALTANSSVIGNCIIGDRGTVSTRATLFQTNMEKDNIAFINSVTGQLQFKKTKECYAQQFFNIDLNLL